MKTGCQTGLRINAAKKLLIRSVPTAMAAVESGFTGYSHMNRRFKRWLGVTPGMFAGIR